MSKPNWDEIRREWESTNKTYKELESQFNVKSSTIRSRKNREKWQRNENNNATQQKKSVATKNKKVATRKNNKKYEEKPIAENDELNDKQRLFCVYYIKYFNATKAYQKAYECDYFTAKTNGSRLLTKANINSEIDRMKEEQTNELKLDVRDVLQKYIDIAFADIGDYVERGDDGFFVKVKPLDQMDTSIISELSNTENGIKLKLADKMRALDMLAKYTDLLSDNQQKRLQEEKIKAETEFTQLRSKQLKGVTKDTSMLDALVQGRKQYEQMMKERENNE